MTILGDFLKTLRLRAGWTCETVAEKLGTGFYVYADMESGRILPDLVTLEQISELYQVPFESMIRACLDTEKAARSSSE